MDGVVVLPNCFSEQECAPLLAMLQSKHRDAVKRVEVPCFDRVVLPVMELFRQRAIDLVQGRLDRRALAEFCMLQANFVTDSHYAHCDNCLDDGSPNHTPHRSHTCNLYLNDCDTDYAGGELNFPELGIKLAPKRGMMVAFPSHRGFKHEVLPIIWGVRRSVLGWFTLDEAKALLHRAAL